MLGWAGLCWVALGWAGLRWAGLGWAGLGWGGHVYMDAWGEGVSVLFEGFPGHSQRAWRFCVRQGYGDLVAGRRALQRPDSQGVPRLVVLQVGQPQVQGSSTKNQSLHAFLKADRKQIHPFMLPASRAARPPTHPSTHPPTHPDMWYSWEAACPHCDARSRPMYHSVAFLA